MRMFLVIGLIVSSVCFGSEDDRRSFELDTRARYSARVISLEEDEGALLTPPMRATKPKSQSVMMYEGHPKPNDEVILVAGVDGRRRIEETESFPWCIHGQMSMEFGGVPYGGSGILVGPHHFLTAAHNIYKPESAEQAKNIRVRLGLNDSIAPFGEMSGTRVYLYRQWIMSRSDEFDIALVVLNSSIGYETGWAGLLCLGDEGLRDHKVHVTGYPGDKGLKTLWTMNQKLSRIEEEKLYYLIDTFGGQSGGAIWIKQLGMAYVVGNHAYGGSIGDGGNFGIRLSPKKIRDVVGWIGETWCLENDVLVHREPVYPVAAPFGLPLDLIPPIATGHEAEYERFLKGSLIYKPNASSDSGKQELYFRELENPLEGVFDLSTFGDAGKRISVRTGYKKEIIPENAGKVEIWICPRFLVEREIGTTAWYLENILYTHWTNPIGILFTWGDHPVAKNKFFYLVNEHSTNNRSNFQDKMGGACSTTREAIFSFTEAIQLSVRKLYMSNPVYDRWL